MLAFLDVNIEHENGKFNTLVLTHNISINTEHQYANCLRYNSKCSDKYKI